MFNQHEIINFKTSLIKKLIDGTSIIVYMSGCIYMFCIMEIPI